MLLADLVEAYSLVHIPAMTRGRCSSLWGWALFGMGACACSSTGEGANAVYNSPADYFLGGQTGSLIPDCDVAPLSEQGQTVPAGDALAVLYAGDCPEAYAGTALSLTDPEGQPVTLMLEPLPRSNTYLLRADILLQAGSYELQLPGGNTHTLSVAAETSELPELVGEVLLREEMLGCPDQIELELALSPEAAAYAPLLRLLVSVDDGREQLWVDYGALELGLTGDATRALLQLPRCGERGCLDSGPHDLSIRAEIAGEKESLQVHSVSFNLDCGYAELLASPASSSSDGGCAMARRTRAASPSADAQSWMWLWGIASCGALARRRKRPGLQLNPRPVPPLSMR